MIDDRDRLLYDDFARKLYAAYISFRMGIGLGYAKKNYTDGPISDYWIGLAEGIDKFTLKLVEEQIGVANDGGKPEVTDTQRLDWVEGLSAPSVTQFEDGEWQVWNKGKRFAGFFLRQAIDAAMKKEDTPN